MIAPVATFLAGVLMASIGHVSIKKGALRGRGQSILRSFLEPYVILGYAFMVGSTVTSTIALKVLPLNLTVALQPLGYVVVVLLSVAVLRERMRWSQVCGMLIIIGGIAVFNLGGP